MQRKKERKLNEEKLSGRDGGRGKKGGEEVSPPLSFPFFSPLPPDTTQVQVTGRGGDRTGRQEG